MKKVPRINLMNKDHVNAEYGNFTLRNKDSYLTTSLNVEEAFSKTFVELSKYCRLFKLLAV